MVEKDSWNKIAPSIYEENMENINVRAWSNAETMIPVEAVEQLVKSTLIINVTCPNTKLILSSLHILKAEMRCCSADGRYEL